MQCFCITNTKTHTICDVLRLRKTRRLTRQTVFRLPQLNYFFAQIQSDPSSSPLHTYFYKKTRKKFQLFSCLFTHSRNEMRLCSQYTSLQSKLEQIKADGIFGSFYRAAPLWYKIGNRELLPVCSSP